MDRRLLRAWPFAAAVCLVAGSARAQDGGGAGGAEDDAAKVREIAIRISKDLKENEEGLARLARGEQGSVKPVAIELPKHNHQGGT